MASIPHASERAVPGADIAEPLRTAPRFTLEARLTALECLASGLNEARECIKHQLERPGYVSAWNGFIALALSLLSADDFAAVRAIQPSWKGESIEDLSMRTSGAQLLAMLDRLGLVEGREAELLRLLQHNRNDCAHPTAFKPSAGEAADYVKAVHLSGLKLLRRASQPAP